jgi:hypothetical protein
MNLKSIVLYLKIKNMKSHDIYDDFVHTLHDEASWYSTVTWWLRSERLARFSEPTRNSTEETEITQIDQAVV